nr:MAG TPA: hypothetical protein [Bacteriophage sp.]
MVYYTPLFHSIHQMHLELLSLIYSNYRLNLHLLIYLLNSCITHV